MGTNTKIRIPRDIKSVTHPKVIEALHAYQKDGRAGIWNIVNGMSEDDLKEYDQWLISTTSPLAQTPGTPKSRFEINVLGLAKYLNVEVLSYHDKNKEWMDKPVEQKAVEAVLISGKTYPQRRQIKSLGGKWKPDEGGWVVPISSRAEAERLAEAYDFDIDITTVEPIELETPTGERLRGIRQDKLDTKRERWQNKIARLESEHAAIEKGLDPYRDWSFITQPILVGHHSEKAHRNLRDRIGKKMDRKVEIYNEIKELKGKLQVSAGGVQMKGDTERARQDQREEQDKIIHKGTMVYDVLYSRNAIVARVNKKTYTLQSVDGLKFTHDKTWVRLLEDQTVPPNLIQYAGAKKKPAAKPRAKKPEPAAASDMASVPVRLGGGGIPPIPGVGAEVAPKPKKATPPEGTSGTVEHFRQILIKYPERREKTIERMRGVLASHVLGRDFGGSMEDYYKQRPDIKRTDEGLQALIAEAGRGTVKPRPTPAAAPKQPRTPAPSVPAIFAPAPAATSDPATVQTGLGGGIPPIPGVGAAAAPKPKRKTAAKAATKKPKPPAKAKSKPKTAAKPAKGKAKKPAPAGITLTAAQKKRLAAKGSITIKRDGKFVTITR